VTLRLKCILAVALVSAVPAALAQQSSGHPSLDRPRSAYDPAAKAGAPASNKSAIGTSLHAVNPQDKDYGEVISQGRLAAIEDTFQNFLWWADLVLATGFVLSLAGNVFQQRRSEDRLRISASIVAQLFNAHSASHAKALEAIEKHNRLADLYNAKCDELAALGQQKQAGEIKKDRQEDAKLAHDLRPGVDKAGAEDARLDLPQQARKERKPGRNQQSETGTVGDPAANVVEQLRAQLIAKDEQLAAKDVQLGAKDQKIQNLRTQINRAHVSLTEEREGRGVGQA